MDLVQLTPRSLAHETKKYLGDVLPTVTDALTELTIAQPPDPFAFLGAFFLNRSNNETVREFAQAVMKGKVPQMDEKTRFLSEEQNQEILDFSNNRRLVQELFDKLDTNKNYTLEITELKNIIECYEGADYSFDANEFMQWYDKDRKNSTKDNALDIDEFGEYIAHLAWVYGQPDIKEAAEVFALITAQFQQCFVTLQTRTAPKGFVLDPVSVDRMSLALYLYAYLSIHCTVVYTIFSRNLKHPYRVFACCIWKNPIFSLLYNSCRGDVSVRARVNV